MNHSEPTLRRPVRLLLRQDVVHEARQHTANLSETVEDLLEAFVAERRGRDGAKQARIDAAIDLLNAHYERHGLIGEEFSPL